MDIERVTPQGVYDTGAYSHVVRAGDTVYIAGQVSRDERGNVIGIGDAQAQAEQVFRNLGACLASVGATFANLVRITTYITRREDLPVVRAVRARHLTTDLP